MYGLNSKVYLLYDSRVTMTILRFILPFLFVRNWYNGAWEFSRMRCILFVACIFLIGLGICIVYILQTPVVYTASPV